jgi:hypothetical protein
MTDFLKKILSKNSHMTMRGGVFGTTVKHVATNKNAKKAAASARRIEGLVQSKAA